jgi:DNA-binding GntR family transcriptional regulator
LSRYLALSDELEADLAGAVAGHPVPSEHEIAAAHGVNRLTARAALQELERRHVVRRVQGLGTFVARRIEYRIGPEVTPSWTSTVRLAGAEPRTVNEPVHTRRARAAERATLGLDAGARVTEVHRLRYVDGTLVATATSVLPTDLVPQLARELGPESSLHDTLVGAYGLHPARDWLRYEVEVAPSAVAARLGLRGRPLLAHHQGRLADRGLGRVIELNDNWDRLDVFDVVVEIGRYGWGA